MARLALGIGIGCAITALKIGAHVTPHHPLHGLTLQTQKRILVERGKHYAYVCHHGRHATKRWHCLWLKWNRKALARVNRALRPRVSAVSSTAVGWPWIALADCESGDGDGRPPYRPSWGYSGRFEGGLQFEPYIWRDYGGGRYASHAFYASPAQQIAIAQRVLADQGWVAWPACSLKLGLR